MSRYEIKHLNSSKGRSTENLPREGLVNEVCKEWLLHEDQALAYRLQNEEYTHHLGHNKERNALLRKDTPRAKEEQFKADEEAARAQYELELELSRQETRDAAIAAAISDQLEKQELEEKRLRELRDLELAKKIAAEDKVKLRQRKELRQVEREAAYLGINAGLDNVALLSRKDKRNRQMNSCEETPFRRSARPLSNDFNDLSDFCLKPEPSLDEDELRNFQENQDEELALLLQEQDLKRRGDLLEEDQLYAIEAQDKELAKVLQEQEKAKAKKAREKARQKALLRQQHQQPRQNVTNQPNHNESSEVLNASTRNSSPDRFESPQYATISSTRAPSQNRPNSPQYATPELVSRMRHSTSPTNLEDNGERVTSAKMKEKANKHKDGRSHPIETPTSGYPPSPSAFPNIACAIDPTYQRRVQLGELTPVASLAHQPPPPSSSRLAHTPEASSSKGAVARPLVFEDEPESYVDDDDDYLPPPYMPIQGQRRTASLEKRKGNTKPPKEVDKGGCKQQ